MEGIVESERREEWRVSGGKGRVSGGEGGE